MKKVKNILKKIPSLGTERSRSFGGVRGGLLVVLFPLWGVGGFSQSIIDQGFCGAVGNGSNLTWVLTSDSVLTISGSGAMANYVWSTDVPWYAYQDFFNTVMIGNGITTIGQCAFQWYSNLTSVTIGNSVTTIGSQAFRSTGITSITIPNSVRTILSSAFQQCSNLASVTIGSGVNSIGADAFYNCSALITIDVNSNNAVFASENGILFNKTKTKLIQYPIGKTDTNYNVLNSVTTIGYNAFSGCNLTSVTMGDSVKTIETGAFRGCINLTSVIIGKGVTTIEWAAFQSCINLISIIIPNGVTTIENNAFYDCSSLSSVTIGNSVTNIGNYAFASCSSLASITIHAIIPPACYDPYGEGSNFFNDVPVDALVYIPCQSYNIYSNDLEWSYFTNFIALPDTTFYTALKCYNVPYTDDNFTVPIDSAGIYCVTFNNINCDSVVCLMLTEYPFLSNYSESICQGNTYTDANFTNLTQAGTYYDTLQTVNGCDSIIELNLIVHATPALTQISDSIYIGDSYNFHGNLLTTAGTYYDTLQNVNDCDSIVELTLTVTGVGIVSITNSELQITSYEIYNMVGQLLLSLSSLRGTQCRSNSEIIDCFANARNDVTLPSGIYVLKLQTNKGIITKKLIIH